MNNNIPLPDDNIAETYNINFNKKLSKKTPENPMKYFWIISFVAFIIKDLVVALPSSLYSWIIMFISFSSSVKGGNIDLSEQYPVWNVLDGVFGSIVIILFGILFLLSFPLNFFLRAILRNIDFSIILGHSLSVGLF